MIKETDLSYIAGFIDADGAIMLQKSHRIALGWNPSYTPIVQAYSSKKEPIEYIQSIFGGNIRRGKRNGKQYEYNWQIAGSKIKWILKSLLPYLKIKKKQAKILINLISWKEKHIKTHITTPHNKSYKKNEFIYLNSVFMKIRSLQTRKGPIRVS